VTLPHRATVTIDCGVSIELPTAYRAVVKPLPFLANKGLIANEGLHIIDKTNHGRIQVTVTNVGKEIIVVNHGDQIAQMYIEPVYRFDWVME
jgi:dUTPase